MRLKNNPLSRRENIVTQQLDGEVLVYDLAKNKAFCLNETSAIVWEMCDGNHTIGEISRKLSERLNSSAREDLVWLAIDELKKENLIANSEDVENKFEGLSRREVIKKVGLGTMIALPLISTLVAPVATNAQSVTAIPLCPVTNPAFCNFTGGGPATCACTSDPQCTTAGNICRPADANGRRCCGTPV